MYKIVVFAANRYDQSKSDYYYQLAYDAGRILAQNGYIVATGAGLGLMDAVLKGAHDNGGETVGIALKIENRNPSKYAKQIQVYEDLDERQSKLIDFADAFLVLPGGIGTISELCQVIANKKVKKDKFAKPILLVGDYYQDLTSFLDKISSRGFSNVDLSSLYKVVQNIDEAVFHLNEVLAVKRIA